MRGKNGTLKCAYLDAEQSYSAPLGHRHQTQIHKLRTHNSEHFKLRRQASIALPVTWQCFARNVHVCSPTQTSSAHKLNYHTAASTPTAWSRWPRRYRTTRATTRMQHGASATRHRSTSRRNALPRKTLQYCRQGHRRYRWPRRSHSPASHTHNAQQGSARTHTRTARTRWTEKEEAGATAPPRGGLPHSWRLPLTNQTMTSPSSEPETRKEDSLLMPMAVIGDRCCVTLDRGCSFVSGCTYSAVSGVSGVSPSGTLQPATRVVPCRSSWSASGI